MFSLNKYGDWGKGSTTKGAREFFEVMKFFFILFVIVVT